MISISKMTDIDVENVAKTIKGLFISLHLRAGRTARKSMIPRCNNNQRKSTVAICYKEIEVITGWRLNLKGMITSTTNQ